MKECFQEEMNYLIGKQQEVKLNPSFQSVIKQNTYNKFEVSPEENTLSRQSTDYTISAYSSHQCSPFKHTIDIDPQQCEQYTDQIFKYLLKVEKENVPNPYYMNYQIELKERMREFLVDWIVELHQKLKLQNESLYLAINILDRYLSVQQVSKRKLQLIGITSLMIACKYEEIYPPEIKDFLFVMKNNYSRSDLVIAERDILNNLKFKITVPYSYTFLQKFQQIAKVEMRNYHLMIYYLELSLLNYNMLQFNPSLIASSAFYLSQIKLNSLQSWPLALQQITDYDENDLNHCVDEMQKLTTRIDENAYIKRKYSSSELSQVARLGQLSQHIDHLEEDRTFANLLKKSCTITSK